MEKFEDLKGKIITNIEHNEDEVIFTMENGDRYKLHHEQDCCESVTLIDTNGEWKDLINSPILWADEVTNQYSAGWESNTWTFYRIGTINGNVVMRWHGSSNGYYSESVYFTKMRAN